jgi:putative transposase
MKRSYSTDLTDAQWACLEFHIPAPNKRGRPKTHTTREILNAIFYVLKSGCAWRLLPRDFPPWETVYWWFRRWRIDRTFKRLNAARAAANSLRKERSSECGHRRLAVVQEDYRGGRRAEGIQRRQEGSLQEASSARGYRGLCAQSQGPQREDSLPQDVLKLLLDSARTAVSKLKHLWLDAGYEDRGKRWAEEVLGLSIEIVRRPPKPIPEEVARTWAQEEWAKEGKEVDRQKLMPPRGLVVLPRRWVVERTFSWLSQNRRMSKDYERLCATAEAFVYVAMTRLMVRRLARA